MSAREAIYLVARREVRQRLREKSLRISLVVTLLIVAAAITLPKVIGGDKDKKVDVAVVGARATALGTTASRVDHPFGVKLKLKRATDDAAARKRVSDGKADVAILADGRSLVQDKGAPDGAVPAIQQVARQAEAVAKLDRAGLAPGAARAVLDPPGLRVDKVDASNNGKGLATLAIFILYGQLITLGIWVAMGIVEEKATRIVEILLAAIRARELLAGKVLGIGIIGLGQLLCVSVLGLGLGIATGQADAGAGAPAALAVVFGGFLLGYALYACAYAVAGSLVPRQEEVQNAAGPVTYLLVAVFIATLSANGNPDGSLAEVLTFLPPSAPLALPLRVIAGDIPVWQAVVSILITLASIVALVNIAARVYSNAVLQVQGRVRLKQALTPA